MREISRLKTDIHDMQASESNSSEAVVTLRNEVRPCFCHRGNRRRTVAMTEPAPLWTEIDSLNPYTATVDSALRECVEVAIFLCNGVV